MSRLFPKIFPAAPLFPFRGCGNEVACKLAELAGYNFIDCDYDRLRSLGRYRLAADRPSVGFPIEVPRLPASLETAEYVVAGK